MPGLAAVKAALRQYALTFDETREDHPSGYGIGKSGWCTVKRPKGPIDVKLTKEWIAESH